MLTQWSMNILQKVSVATVATVATTVVHNIISVWLLNNL